jgi:hypothetical protein
LAQTVGRLLKRLPLAILQDQRERFEFGFVRRTQKLQHLPLNYQGENRSVFVRAEVMRAINIINTIVKKRNSPEASNLISRR